MGSKVTVEVDLDRRGSRITVRKELSIWIVEDEFKALDHPDDRVDPFSRMLCTPTLTIDATMKSRHEIATKLAAELTQALLDAMGASDTRMGYPQAPNMK